MTMEKVNGEVVKTTVKNKNVIIKTPGDDNDSDIEAVRKLEEPLLSDRY